MAYRAARINQIVGMHSPDAVIECACGGRKIIYGQGSIAAYWRHRFLEMPALELEDLQTDGGVVVISYGKLHRRCQFRTTLQCVRTLAGFYLAKFSFNLVAVLRAECLDGCLLCLEAKTTSPLLEF
jgi:hypothetical protein